MDFQFDRPTEAIAAISWLICSADDVGTVEERNFLHQELIHTKEFENMNASEFSSLLATTRIKLFSNFANNGFCLTKPATDEVIHAAKMILNDEQKIEAYKMALALAKSDGIVEAESEILNKLRSRFAITFEQLDS